jgi:hypothetical protein
MHASLWLVRNELFIGRKMLVIMSWNAPRLNPGAPRTMSAAAQNW